MVRMPIIFAFAVAAGPAQAASGDRGTGWHLNADGIAMVVASRAAHAIDRGDISAVTDDSIVQSVAVPKRDVWRIGTYGNDNSDQIDKGAIARISAHLSF